MSSTRNKKLLVSDLWPIWMWPTRSWPIWFVADIAVIPLDYSMQTRTLSNVVLVFENKRLEVWKSDFCLQKLHIHQSCTTSRVANVLSPYSVFYRLPSIVTHARCSKVATIFIVIPLKGVKVSFTYHLCSHCGVRICYHICGSFMVRLGSILHHSLGLG